MANFMQPEEIKAEKIPGELPILPLRNTLAYPHMVLPLAVGIPRSVKLIEDALQGDKLVGLVGMSDASIEEPTADQVWTTGTVARIHRVIRTDENMQVIAQGIERFRIAEWLEPAPYLRAKINIAPDVAKPDLELDALERSLRELTREVVALSPHLPDEVNKFLAQVEDVRHLVYVVASNARLKKEEGQAVLEADDIGEKIRLLIRHLSREKKLLTLEHKIQSEAHEEMEKAQREFFLRQQLRAIRKELGEEEEGDAAVEDYRQKIEASGMPEEAKKEAHRELKRLENMPPQAAEHSVIKTYLDWLVDLPWNKRSDDRLDIQSARAILDEDHYDLQNVKDRILEYLAVRKLVAERAPKRTRAKAKEQGEPEAPTALGTILCFAGPPGVGKTSLGQSIARSLGRKFTRMSLGGMRDEAEIRGHRRTYVGALPGRIIQGIKRAGTRNPVFMLDEVDKLASDWRGDPSSALLEVLDPVQNKAFRDYYLDVDFDLSEVIFIATANYLDSIPGPLRDRMEIIELEGYTEHEKLQIAQHYLVPRQLKQNGLTAKELTFTRDALRKVIRDYTREAGVRDLERQIGTLCRKAAVTVAAGNKQRQTVTPIEVRTGLKRERWTASDAEKKHIPGVSTGLAVTTGGGDILFIEASGMAGRGELTLTGQLGDVMRESARIAHSYVRANAGRFGIDVEKFAKTDIHVHVPAGAVPKDGPSAGVAMVTAMVSLLTGTAARPGVGMTGEVTLRGRVLPVGGVKMKVLAAHRSGLRTVVLPKRNEADLDELPDEVKKAMHFVLVEQIEDGLKATMPDGTVKGESSPGKHSSAEKTKKTIPHSRTTSRPPHAAASARSN